MSHDECQVVVASASRISLVTFGMYDSEAHALIEAPDTEVGCQI